MIELLYATQDGHTRKIAETLAAHLTALGHAVALTDLGGGDIHSADLLESEAVVIVAPIRFGYHLPPVEAFIKANKTTLRHAKLAMASVNLTARKQGKDTPETNGYMRKWLKRHGMQPTVAAVFAGRLDYSLCKTWERWAIRLIMAITKGPTDFDTIVEYTDWTAVVRFAQDIADLATSKAKAKGGKAA